MTEPLRFYLNCHGSIDESEELIEIPKNVKIITFTAPQTLSNIEKDSTFIFYAMTYGNEFIKEFSKALYFFNTKLYDIANYFITKDTLHEEPKPYNYNENIEKLKTYKYCKEIFTSILNAGKDDCSGIQHINMYGHGSMLPNKISNYQLEKKINEYVSVTMDNNEISNINNDDTDILLFIKASMIYNESFIRKYDNFVNKITFEDEQEKKYFIRSMSPKFIIQKNTENAVYICEKNDIRFIQPNLFSKLKNANFLMLPSGLGYNILIEKYYPYKDDKEYYRVHSNFTRHMGLYAFNPDYNGYENSPLNKFLYWPGGKYEFMTNIWEDMISEDLSSNIDFPFDKISLNKTLQHGTDLKILLRELSDNAPEKNIVLFLNCCKDINDNEKSKICPEWSLLNDYFIESSLKENKETEGDEYEDVRFYMRN